MRKPFNLDSMSGVYSGTRTSVFRYIGACATDSVTDSAKPTAQTTTQLLLQWYTTPASIRIMSQQPASAPDATASEPQLLADVPLVGSPDGILKEFDATLADLQLQPECCYACRHWSPYADLPVENQESAAQARYQAVDGLPDGRCGWSQDEEPRAPQADARLRRQSALSPACTEFKPRSVRGELPPPVPPPMTPPEPQKSYSPKTAPAAGWPLRLWRRLQGAGGQQPSGRSQNPLDTLMERSGVGAGTEPCYFCQGRLANLGALAVESDEGDKQTLSVWRCRQCHTLYLNDWTDRWERLDSLETEERYTRLAPAEAMAALHIVHDVQGGDHPGQRAERSGQRAQLLAMVQNKPAVSHQVRMGR